jgi:c(7)-type cytochrome triheme protein
MQKAKKRVTRTGLLAAAFAIGMIIFGAPKALRADDNLDRAAQARIEAEKARAEAEKAMAEAEKAMSEADRAIAEAERLKAKAREEKANAIEKMVAAGRYPEDISMTEPDTTTVAVFSHKKHTERERLKCIECHPNVFIMKVGKNVVKKGQLTMAEMKKGRYCGNCHNGHKAFSVTDIASCKRCHPQQNQ